MLVLYIQTKPLNDDNLGDWVKPGYNRIHGIYTLNTHDGKVQAVYHNENTSILIPDFLPLPDEKQLLVFFWSRLQMLNQKAVKTLITYNGRGFVLPTLYLRSLAHGLRITDVPYMRQRYDTTYHIDLMEALSFHNCTQPLPLLHVLNLIQHPLPIIQEDNGLQRLMPQTEEQSIRLVLKSGLDYLMGIHQIYQAWKNNGNAWY